ncbi:hypothetical protein O6H91_03G006900 [Diphasiastrum complanatum]|uniref:Uncharacterized protein n=1 Tax=Diphasiastrum complanatum TaxID=34168 RepID=A0ACC2E338_DIPCM|nr:hypothetical protein O6H91_03G006900 [Diphasiastrum complanatum]
MATMQQCSFPSLSIACLRICSLSLILLHLQCASVASTVTHAKQVYIAYLGHTGSLEPTTIGAQHHEMLVAATGSKEIAEAALIYNYKHSFRGFAARLSEDEVSYISRMPGVLSVFPSKSRTLQTTRSWRFLGIDKDTSTDSSSSQSSNDNLWLRAKFSEDVIIGLLDTGIWPESESFQDDSLPPIPRHWKGSCETGVEFNASLCNRKLIGARMYLKGYEHTYGPLNVTATGEFLSARDKDGHGTHTSSTAAGKFVPNANTFGFGNGTAKGGAPRARIAMYKTCWPIPAGNDGPTPATASNLAPWLVTVAASTIDRSFPSPAILGNGTVLKGESISPDKLANRFYPLIFAGNAGRDNKDASQCLPNSLDPAKVKGKVVFCVRGLGTRVGKSMEVLNAGGIAYILGNAPANGTEVAVDAYALPGTAINAADAAIAQEYIKLSGNPQVKILPGTTALGIKPAPVIPSFSSRGPNSLNPQILKPDISAPGVNILAAWTGGNSPTHFPDDHRRVAYNIISGTSMACPHAAGVGALLRSIYPTWSPAAIKSAIMTTAKVFNNLNQPIATASEDQAGPFDYGAGEINPIAAADPGLIYDAKPRDYLLFLCKAGLGSSQIQAISGLNFSCGPKPPKISNLNYPSVAITKLKKTQIVKRTVTNVGPMGTYSVSVQAPPGVHVDITPKSLHFGAQGERRKFKIKLTVSQSSKGKYVFGSFTWSDGAHVVRSPIAVQSI